MEKTHFELNGFKVQDYKDQNFAKYTVPGTNQCFNEFENAVLYCIGASHGKVNNSKLHAYVDTFVTMIKK